MTDRYDEIAAELSDQWDMAPYERSVAAADIAAAIRKAVEDEREACALVCVDFSEEDWRGASRAGVLRTAAAAIRARSTK